MFNGKKFLAGGSVMLSSLLLFTGIAGASPFETSAEQSQNLSSQADKQLSISDKNLIQDSILINGRTESLYPTFANQEEALNKLKGAIPDYLSEISQTYGLSEINDSNWEEYVHYAQEYASSVLSEEDANYNVLLSFADIYENKAKNDHIKELVGSLSAQRSTGVIAEEVQQELAFSLPYTSNLANEQNELQLQKESATANIAAAAVSFDFSRAMQYVNLYATSPNSDSFGTFSNDCTNFASQILYAGNVSQVDFYPNENLGWWHRKVTASGPIIYPDHKYSLSWINADTFARYMGVGYTTTNHSSFSGNLQAGDFIAYDRDRDGDWNHIGFVTSVNSSQGTYNGLTYYDYRVAQHTTNYHAWTSSSTNGWETLANVTYARVRR